MNANALSRKPIPLLPASCALCLFVSSFGLVSGAPAAEVESPKRIYLAPDDHTDYLWSLDEAGYRQALVEMVDYYLHQIDATATNPPPFQGRWNCDGSFWLWTYEKHKTSAEFNRLIERVRDRHISAPLTTLVSCYGGQPTEAVLRGMYYAGSLDDGGVHVSASARQIITYRLIPRARPGANANESTR